MPPEQELGEIEWIPRPRVAPLGRLGLRTLRDLVMHYPRRHEDRRQFDRFPDGEMDHAICICGTVVKTATKFLPGRRRMCEVIIEEHEGAILGNPVTCRWFNMPFISKMIATGDTLVVYGRPKARNRQVVMDHPEFEVIEDDEEALLHLKRITPIHPAGDGISARILRSFIHRALAETDMAGMAPLMPDSDDEMRYGEALRAIQFPESLDELAAARARLVREEFFGMQLLLRARRAKWNNLPGRERNASGELVGRLLENLPFALTESQRAVNFEIQSDLESPRRMNRLLQGDVGSGKTLVALMAMLHVVEGGWQAALMAPTQILAEQHYLNFQRLLDPLGIAVSLRTGAKKEEPLFASKAQIVVGTHALLYESAEFKKLGLIIIDEQHKFGVMQRAKLVERGDAPDVLVMTATPIPRTITQTLYGDLDVSILREKPAGRGEIQTVARPMEKLPEVVDFVRKQIDKGRQAYIVYPLVEESEKLEAKSAKTEFVKWQELLAPRVVGLLHGRLPPDEKEDVMKRFRNGELAALVATTVIEVGVDVPNANILVVENAERFGLAQLHQLRGRIGRGAHKSYCVLLHDKKAEEGALAKLAVLEQTADGFEIAEADLRLRGPGDLLGTAQTGLPPLRLGDLFKDAPLMDTARKAADSILKLDPDLADHQALRDHVSRSERAWQASIG